jgi:hypothetical protein
MPEPVVVRCPRCAAQNRVAKGRRGFRPVCGACQAPLLVLASFEPTPARPRARSRLRSASPWLAAAAVAGSFGAYAIHAASPQGARPLTEFTIQPVAPEKPAPVQAPPRPQAQTQSNQPRSPGNARLPEETAAVRKPEMQIAQGARPGVVDNALDDVPAINRPQPAPGKEPNQPARKPGVSEAGVAQPQGFKAKPVPFRQGVLNVHGRESRVAQFKVTTPPGTERYYVKLVRGRTKATDYMTMLIAPGSTFETKVATGTFRMKYATGSDWFGPADKFGPGT